MTHLPQLIQDLAFILMTAALVTLVFKKLKQPVVLGYLCAGILLGPNFSFFPNVQDKSNISIWAEIGVIFMVFGLGLEFSFKKLAQVGKSASITAGFEIFFMLLVGYGTGQILGWSKMDSLFLGGMISISSTTIIVRAFEELGLKGKSFVSLVFGVLVVEDLLAILLLVLLSSVAATATLSGSELISSSLKLGFFLVLWFLLGIYLLPLFFKQVKKLLTEETTLIVSLGLCLMMVFVATTAGFSTALGAFVMGSLLSETSQGHQIEKLLTPVKNLFSAIFFVSVGMLIDPGVLVQYWPVILLLTFITVLGKLLSTSLGAILSGQNFKSSIQAGMSMTQIGEFSFIIATLGITLKVTSPFLYPVAVAVSVLTTFFTPYLIKLSPIFYGFLEKHLPPALLSSLSRYESALAPRPGTRLFGAILRAYALPFILNSVIVIGISLLPFDRVGLLSDGTVIGKSICCFVAITLGMPFLWAIMWGVSSANPRFERLQFGIIFVRIVLGFVLLGVLIEPFFQVASVMGLGLYTLGMIFIFASRQIVEPIYQKIETRFLSHLMAENTRDLGAPLPALAPWNAVLSEFSLSPSSALVAKTLGESGIKERTGSTVAMIQRGSKRILAPTRSDLLLPYDRIFLMGSEEQLANARDLIETEDSEDNLPDQETFGLGSLMIGPNHSFVQKSIRDCGLRESVSGLIVGLERNDIRYLNPDASMVLLPEDLLWIVGNLHQMKNL